jgi:hypothetical protein
VDPFEVVPANVMPWFHVEPAEGRLFHVEPAWLLLVTENVARTTTTMRAMAAKKAIRVREVVWRAVMALLLFLGF